MGDFRPPEGFLSPETSAKILCLGLSLRHASFNVRLARVAAEMAREAGAEAESLALRDLGIPLYDADIEASSGIPSAVAAVAERIRAARGLIVATPEYNHSAAGVAKNAIDWLSRVRPYLFERKPVLLLAASTGPRGGILALESMRQVMAEVDALVHPEAFGVARAREAFGAGGGLADPAEAARLRDLIRTWLASTGPRG